MSSTARKLASTVSPNLPTNGTIDSRLGTLEIINGFPTGQTVRKLYDALDFQRACQAYLWALPYMAMEEWQREQRETFGAGNLDWVDYVDLEDKLGILTANATTPYSIAFPNLEDTGPLVLEVPPGPTAGAILDFWQRPLTDCGQTGPDKGLGGRFLVLGPNDGDLVADGYYVVRTPTNNFWIGMRTLDPDIVKATALSAQLKIYPYVNHDDPPATKHIAAAGRRWSGEQPRGIEYWKGLAEVISEEPAIERDRIMLATLIPLGIEKGEPFRPDERQKRILIDAANVGELMARTIGYAKRFPGVVVWPGKRWEYPLFLAETNQEKPNATQLDERTSWFYEAVGVSVGMMGRTVGAGQVYLSSPKDSSGEWLDGGKHYVLHVPNDVPVAQFWSFTVYDNESRCLIDTGSPPERSSRDGLVQNADGSIDLFFGPSPGGNPERNWIKTLPRKGWFTYFRLYAPTQRYFDKTWVLPDIEEMK